MGELFSGFASAAETLTRKALLAYAAMLLVLLIPFAASFDSPAAPMDEGTLLVYPERVLNGAMPYRDFETFYGPANPYVLAGVYRIFGPDIMVERAVGLAYRVVILGALFAFARRWSTTTAAACVAISGCVLLLVGAAAYAWIGGIACALWALCLTSRTSRPRNFFAGLLASAALLFRPDLGPAVILMAVASFFSVEKRSRIAYAIGAVVGLLPLGLVASAMGFRPLVDNLFLIPVFQASAGRRLPLSQATAGVICLLSAHLIACGTNIFAGIVDSRKTQSADKRHYLLLASGLFSLGLTHQALQRADDWHVALAAFVSLGFLPLSCFVLFRYWRFEMGPRRASHLAVAAAVSFIAILVPDLTVNVRQHFIRAVSNNARAWFYLEEGGRRFPFGAQDDVRETQRMFTFLNDFGSPGERVFVGPADLRFANYNDAYLYHLLPQFTPATYYLEMNPGVANAPGSRLAADVASADWLILSARWDDSKEQNRATVPGPDAPNVVVRERFDACGKFGLYLLYHRRKQVATGT